MSIVKKISMIKTNIMAYRQGALIIFNVHFACEESNAI